MFRRVRRIDQQSELRSELRPHARGTLRRAATLGAAVAVLVGLLDHDDAEVRLDAVVALGLTRTRRAEKPLRDRLAVEPDAAVRSQIESQLRTLLGRQAGKPD